MIKWLRQLTERQALGYALYPLLALGLLFPNLQGAEAAMWTNSYGFASALQAPAWWWIVVNALVLVITALLINRTVNRFNIFARPTIGPGLFMLFFALVWISDASFSPAVWACFFFVLSLRPLLDIYKQNKVLQQCFAAGLYLGLAAQFVPELYLALPVYLVISLRVRSFQWREWLLILSGSLLPVIYSITLHWFFQLPIELFFARFAFQSECIPSWHLLIGGAAILLGLVMLPLYFQKSNAAGRRIGSLLFAILMIQIPLIILVGFWTYHNEHSPWLLLAPWIGLNLTVWLQTGASSFFKTLLISIYVLTCIVGLLLRMGAMSL